MAADNVSLGNFNLTGIAPAPRGIPQIEVTFDINADGILDVSAKDLATDKEQKITITASTKLKEDDIDKMVKEAEKFAEQDKKKKEEVELRNQADSIIYTTRKTIEDLGDKITKDQKEKLEKATKELEDALSGKDLDKIKKKVDSLTTLLQQIGATVYQQAASKQAKSDKKKTSQKKNKEKVVNADYKVVDKDKK
jgi:molecular chaperone DnaK